MAAVATRILTWNLQGRERPPLDAVAAVLDGFRPDVVALQEVQRPQALRLAHLLGWRATWRFKHWPLVVAPEGLAVLTPEPVTELRHATLAAGPRFWSHRRRVALAAHVATPDGPLVVVDAHLGSGVAPEERVRQARETIDLLGGAHGCIVGDLNTRPGSAVIDAYAAAGLRDAWVDVHPDAPGHTNWGPGPRDHAPTKRIDFVLVTETLEVVAAEVPTAGEPGFDGYGALSDHLPVLVEVAPRR